MFKIVQTIEGSKLELTIVPTAWECNNVLKWPKKNAHKMQKIASSLPESHWFQMKCKVKRNNLPTYEIAENELEKMLEVEDTEQEESVPTKVSERPSRILIPNRKYENSANQNDFNSLTEHCLMVSFKS